MSLEVKYGKQKINRERRKKSKIVEHVWWEGGANFSIGQLGYVVDFPCTFIDIASPA